MDKDRKTSVDWLHDRLKLSLGDEIKDLRGFFVVAKEMEEQQSYDDYMVGYQKGWSECNEHIKRDIKHLYHKYQID